MPKDPDASYVPAAVGLAPCAALFFTLTCVLNRSLVAVGGHWAWAVILRYLITLPLQDGLSELPRELRRHPGSWLLWSSVGFMLFGIPLIRPARCWRR